MDQPDVICFKLNFNVLMTFRLIIQLFDSNAAIRTNVFIGQLLKFIYIEVKLISIFYLLDVIWRYDYQRCARQQPQVLFTHPSQGAPFLCVLLMAIIITCWFLTKSIRSIAARKSKVTTFVSGSASQRSEVFSKGRLNEMALRFHFISI